MVSLRLWTEGGVKKEKKNHTTLGMVKALLSSRNLKKKKNSGEIKNVARKKRLVKSFNPGYLRVCSDQEAIILSYVFLWPR